MDEPMRSNSRLEVSVSFGRFDNDALSWEKWSSFSPNKYLEEVGNLSTPGSVAQKKAYFEAHYKKIAAQKAEELEQEKLMNSVTPSPAVSSKEDSAANSFETDGSNGFSHGEQLSEEVAQESCMALLASGSVVDEVEDDDAGSCERDKQETCMNGLITAIALEEVKEDVAAALERESSAIEEAKNESSNNAKGAKLHVKEETPLVKSATSQKQSQNSMEKSSERKNRMEQSVAAKSGNSKSNSRNIAPKVTLTKKEKTLTGAKNSIISPPAKPLQTSNPRYSKPSSMNTLASAPKTLRKQVNGSPTPPTSRDKNPPMGQSRRSAPTALHMSLNLNSSNSLASGSTTRKSFIMEQMGDKDIVKRAFKTFQNRANGSVTDERPKSENMSSPAFAAKVSVRTPTKGNEGPRKDSLNRVTQRSQSGTRSNPLLKGLNKSCVMDRKNTLATSQTKDLSSDEKAEKRKEFLKNLEAKSIARGVAKSKVHIVNQNPARPTLSP